MKKNTPIVLLIAVISLTACSSLPKSSEFDLDSYYSYYWVKPDNVSSAVETSEIAQALSQYDVIFFGELHTQPGVHLAQMELLSALEKQGRPLTLSMEQFERDTQHLIDNFLAGEIGEEYLIEKARAWDNYMSSYRPLMEFAKEQHMPVIASNAPKSIVVCVGRHGLPILDKYPAEERQHIAEDIDVSASEYRDRFMRFMKHDSAHGGTSDPQSRKRMEEKAQRSFAAQVVRDETMAESIQRHLEANPGRQVLHLNGNFHSSGYGGTVKRLQKRQPNLKVAVIHAVTTRDSAEAALINDRDKGDILLLVKPLPNKFVQQEHRQQWLQKVIKKRRDQQQDCP